MDKDTEKRLSDIFSSYKETIHDRLIAIENSWIKLQSTWDHIILEQLYMDVHKLHGTAGICGFKELSDIAGKLEAVLCDIKKHGDVSQKQRELIKNIVHELKSAAY